MMGYALCHGYCIGCGRIFSFNPMRMPSVSVNDVREPICRDCVEHINPQRIANGLDGRGSLMISYHGRRDRAGNCHVWVKTNGRARPLPLRLKLANHSPTGFEWGYSGSGPAQLALAILADALRNDGRALRLHQDFKRVRIAGLPRHEAWTITREEVVAWVEAREEPFAVEVAWR